MRENLSTEFPTRYGSKEHARLQRLVGALQFCMEKFDYYTFQIVNSIGADQTTRMRRLS